MHFDGRWWNFCPQIVFRQDLLRHKTSQLTSVLFLFIIHWSDEKIWSTISFSDFHWQKFLKITENIKDIRIFNWQWVFSPILTIDRKCAFRTPWIIFLSNQLNERIRNIYNVIVSRLLTQKTWHLILAWVSQGKLSSRDQMLRFFSCPYLFLPCYNKLGKQPQFCIILRLWAARMIASFWLNWNRKRKEASFLCEEVWVWQDLAVKSCTWGVSFHSLSWFPTAITHPTHPCLIRS